MQGVFYPTQTLLLLLTWPQPPGCSRGSGSFSTAGTTAADVAQCLQWLKEPLQLQPAAQVLGEQQFRHLSRQGLQHRLFPQVEDGPLTAGQAEAMKFNEQEGLDSMRCWHF